MEGQNNQGKKIYIIDDNPLSMGIFIERLLDYLFDEGIRMPEDGVTLISIAQKEDKGSSEDEQCPDEKTKIEKIVDAYYEKYEKLGIKDAKSYLNFKNEKVWWDTPSGRGDILGNLKEKIDKNATLLLDLLLQSGEEQDLNEEKAILSHNIYLDFIDQNRIILYTNYSDENGGAVRKWIEVFEKTFNYDKLNNKHSTTLDPEIYFRSDIDGSDAVNKSFFDKIFQE